MPHNYVVQGSGHLGWGICLFFVEQIWFPTGSSTGWRGQDGLLCIPATMPVTVVRQHLSLSSSPHPLRISRGSWSSQMKAQSSTLRNNLLSYLKARCKAGMPLPLKHALGQSSCATEPDSKWGEIDGSSWLEKWQRIYGCLQSAIMKWLKAKRYWCLWFSRWFFYTY